MLEAGHEIVGAVNDNHVPLRHLPAPFLSPQTSSETPAFSHFWISSGTRLSATRWPIQFTRFFRSPGSAHQAPRARYVPPEPVRKAFEVRLVNLIEHGHHGLLNNLVLQRRDTQRTFPPVSLRNVHSP